ncbi:MULTISPECIES: zinc-binding alcohol dehydrogenase [Microbacterium]|uniref:zinc-binding alcohol dehydrogenase n=1 Tax=Microbacterium TaxID=33882 RepID=UPI00217EA72D|nr:MULTISPECIES: zinc-binding alcohol dehydrogenase [Microbacterium]UWF77684.1 zinc-binding alcohol dehydrogenase [Microbacterium neungamense]WCM55853.1 zinc-binding alcohol dehydrogenase [Microbacterium sp. EF45047]
MVDKPQWLIREDASTPVLVALALRQLLGVRAPDDLPALRGLEVRAPDAAEANPAVERQWRDFWDMTVEPRAHRSDVPLELVDGFDTLVALPATGAEELREAIVPHAETALRYAHDARRRYVDSVSSAGDAYRAYASAIAEFEREVGRRAHSFELNVQVLPFTQRGIWWIGALTVAVTDTLRRDVVAFDVAIRPVIGELA